ncbi:hypothetical protein ACA910_020020 [Epithemia clementina (nom. ined.)]
MFYSQIILAKKGPLGHLWMAAHFQDRKLSRAQIFATDIGASVESIVHPAVPLALRVSGHLLLGVVRIYSKKVQYLWQDCHQAMVQIQMAFIPQQQQHSKNSGDKLGIDMDNSGAGAKDTGRRRRRTRDKDGGEQGDEDDLILAAIPATTAMQGFGIPFDLMNEDDENNNAEDWVPAELMDQDGMDLQSPAAAAALGLTATSSSPDPSQQQQQQPLRKKRSLARAAADATLHSIDDDLYTEGGGRRSSVAAPDEQWTAFDPDDGEEEEEEEHEQQPPKQSKPPAKKREEETEPSVPMMEEEEPAFMPFDDEEEEEEDDQQKPPAVPTEQDQSSLQAEIPRANESVASESAAGRPSALLLKDGTDNSKAAAGISEAEFSISKDVSGIPILDDENDAGPVVVEGRQGSSLNLNQSSASSIKPQDESSAAAVSWGEGGTDENDGESSKKRKSSTSVKEGRKRKRRRVRANDGDIELSSAEIRTMLMKTDDIVIRPPPIGQEEVDEKPLFELQGLTATNVSSLLMDFLSYEQLFDRPALADDGGASPELLELWVLSAKLRDEVRKNAGQEGVVVLVEQENEEQEEEEEEASLKDDKRVMSTKGSGSVDDEDVEVARQGQSAESDVFHILEHEEEEETNVPLPQEEEEPQPEEEEEPPTFADNDEPPPVATEESVLEEEVAENKRTSSLSLGLVNTLGEDMEWDNEDEENERQEAGDEIVSSNSKWHKHTIKVYSLLKSRMAPPGASAMADKEPHLSYNILSDGCSRRTAVGVFFELLQLKTWDFIEVNQDEAYGDIIISPGAKFAEPAPTS